jgi:hypothetical protein
MPLICLEQGADFAQVGLTVRDLEGDVQTVVIPAQLPKLRQ